MFSTFFTYALSEYLFYCRGFLKPRFQGLSKLPLELILTALSQLQF